MDLRLAEGLCNDLATWLSTVLPAELSMMEADDPDTPLPAPQKYVVNEFDMNEIPQWPVVYIFVPRALIPQWQPGLLHVNYDVAIGIAVLDQSPERLKRRVWRYVQTIVRLLVESQVNEGLDWILHQNFSIDYSPIYTRDQEFLSDAQIVVTMRSRTLEVF